MNYDFSALKERIAEIEERLSQEMKSINTGRANPSLLDGVRVDSYGAKVAISHVATVAVEDPRTLRVTPWDKGSVKSIESAINDADLGVSVSADASGLRVHFPDLTTERRRDFVKIARKYLEEARVSVRAERESVWSDIQKKQREGDLTEDEKFSLKDALQDIVDEANKKLEEIAERKEREILS